MFSFINKLFRKPKDASPTPTNTETTAAAEEQKQPAPAAEANAAGTDAHSSETAEADTQEPTGEPASEQPAEPVQAALSENADEEKQPAPAIEPETDNAVAENVTQNETTETAAEETAQPETEESAQSTEQSAQPDNAEEEKQPAPAIEPEADNAVAENVTQNETIETAAEETAQPKAEESVQAALPKAEAPKAVTEMPPQVQPEEEEPLNWTARLVRGLDKSRNHMAKSLAGVFGGGKIDEDLYEELETVLLTSDMGIEATEHLMKEVRERVSLRGLKDGKELRQALKEAIYDLLKPLEKPLVLPENGQPFVMMMAGINGAGKTTSIGKLAKYFQKQGKSVMLAAGDTFRAAAREQLQEWGERNGVVVISQEKGDSAAVCFDAVEAAKARKIDVVLADTAGRLPTQLHLMEEIKKVKRVLQKSMPDAPHEIIVVLDANIGQNAVNQVVAFDDALGVTGLIVTKLDGTAKGGVLAALASSRAIPVRFIGVGERIDDLRPFNARAFVDALLDEGSLA
ncbi:signal recognition particle-docking protein FtsY [Kingella denitrificans]|uniref:signal recognition particle-docking protein FtsY n=1 Tax=Kingella denitrificans TaxID=502 RepID=UPI000B97F744|nr:signal recognition particle-docking protein FtsY [Kingella denitrificans]